jgi:hypothetical protein
MSDSFVIDTYVVSGYWTPEGGSGYAVEYPPGPLPPPLPPLPPMPILPRRLSFDDLVRVQVGLGPAGVRASVAAGLAAR